MRKFCGQIRPSRSKVREMSTAVCADVSAKPVAVHPSPTSRSSAYLIAAAFDVASYAGGHPTRRARRPRRQLWHAATFVFLIGAAISLLAALTGLMALGSPQKRAPRPVAPSIATPPS